MPFLYFMCIGKKMGNVHYLEQSFRNADEDTKNEKAGLKLLIAFLPEHLFAVLLKETIIANGTISNRILSHIKSIAPESTKMIEFPKNRVSKVFEPPKQTIKSNFTSLNLNQYSLINTIGAKLDAIFTMSIHNGGFILQAQTNVKNNNIKDEFISVPDEKTLESILSSPELFKIIR